MLPHHGTPLLQVYIEMSRDEKSKGKAAVDLLGSQIGKSGAGLSCALGGAPQGGRRAIGFLGHCAGMQVSPTDLELDSQSNYSPPAVRRYTLLHLTPPRPAPAAGGAWLTQAVLLLLGSISASMPLIATFFTGVIAAWLGAVKRCAAPLLVGAVQLQC